MTAKEQRIDTLRLVALVALTGVLVFLGVVSFVNRLTFEESTDGVVWLPSELRLIAESLVPRGPGERAGLVVGDELLEIGNLPVQVEVPDFVESVLWNQIPGNQLTYLIDRGGQQFEIPIEVGGLPVDNYAYFYLCLVGAALVDYRRIRADASP